MQYSRDTYFKLCRSSWMSVSLGIFELHLCFYTVSLFTDKDESLKNHYSQVNVIYQTGIFMLLIFV
jgi:hypothetical protein